MEELTREDLDILGEIANISLGNAATTLSMMVNHKVNITTPNIKIINRSESMDDFEKTCIFVQIHYVLGLAGNNVFILKENDVLCLTSLMMGGDGSVADGSSVGELELSAVSEAMNQMMGTSATSMATMLERSVDISTPQVNAIDVESVKVFEKMFETFNEKFVKITFRLDIVGLIDSTMVQLYPVSFAKDMVKTFKIHEKDKDKE